MLHLVVVHRCYFIKDQNDKIWRIVFTSFEGSSAGSINLILEEMSSSTFISDNQIDISSFEIFQILYQIII